MNEVVAISRAVVLCPGRDDRKRLLHARRLCPRAVAQTCAASCRDSHRGAGTGSPRGLTPSCAASPPGRRGSANRRRFQMDLDIGYRGGSRGTSNAASEPTDATLRPSMSDLLRGNTPASGVSDAGRVAAWIRTCTAPVRSAAIACCVWSTLPVTVTRLWIFGWPPPPAACWPAATVRTPNSWPTRRPGSATSPRTAAAGHRHAPSRADAVALATAPETSDTAASRARQGCRRLGRTVGHG